VIFKFFQNRFTRGFIFLQPTMHGIVIRILFN